MNLDVVNLDNKITKAIAVQTDSAAVLNKALVYYALKAQLNNKRHGTVKTKTRGEVCRTKKKVFKQKGTGNARHGARSANIFVGGGNVFGPLPRSYFEYLNKSSKKEIYQNILQSKLATNSIKLFNSESVFEAKPSTKKASAFIKSLKVKDCLIVSGSVSGNVGKSFRNLKNTKVIGVNNLNVIDLLNFETVLMDEKAFEQASERYLK